jgi:hypothetical protein
MTLDGLARPSRSAHAVDARRHFLAGSGARRGERAGQSASRRRDAALHARTSGEGACQLGAGIDVELAVGAREVHLKDLLGQGERLSDLAVRQSLRSDARDPKLARGEGVPALDRIASRPRAGRDQRVVGAGGENARAAGDRDVEPVAQCITRRGAVPGAPQRRPELDERAREQRAAVSWIWPAVRACW